MFRGNLVFKGLQWIEYQWECIVPVYLREQKTPWEPGSCSTLLVPSTEEMPSTIVNRIQKPK